jgi:adenylosuccinate lyase
MSEHLIYENPLTDRYASQEMAELWGPQRKFSTWRRLWVALAEAQYELGMPGEKGAAPRIRQQQIDEMRSHVDDIDFDRARALESKLRHDVMAHIHAFGEACPTAKEIIHLGATSCFVTDNTDLILMREALTLLRGRLVAVLRSLAEFAKRYRDVATVGFTHFQPAQLTTVGKRACLWCQDFLFDFHEIEHRLAGLRFRGVKGTTGTQASFLALFRGDHAKVRELDRRVAAKMGFSEVYPVTGQTYSRKIDSQVLDALSGLGQSAQKLGTDLRLLAHRQEVDEPFEADQVGSSAMAYKRNPMRSERLCSIGRFVSGLPGMAAQTAAGQWLERTLDDSAIRRLYIPQAFLGADGLLRLTSNISGGLVVNEQVIRNNVFMYMPYMATEPLLMAAVANGQDRQTVHECIRRHSIEVTQSLKAGKGGNDLLDRLRKEKLLAGVPFDKILSEENFMGRSPQQTDEFLLEHVQPVLGRFQTSSELISQIII